jgi:hypothetical protein
VHAPTDVTVPAAVTQSSTTFHVPTTFPPHGDTLPQLVRAAPELELPHADGPTAAKNKCGTEAHVVAIAMSANLGARRNEERPARTASLECTPTSIGCSPALAK